MRFLICVSQLNELKNQIIDFENNHEDNLSRPIDCDNIPVAIPMTSDFEGKIDISTHGLAKNI